MLSSPDAKGSKGERLGMGGSQSVVEPSTATSRQVVFEAERVILA
jgi:hypothetical protein